MFYKLFFTFSMISVGYYLLAMYTARKFFLSKTNSVSNFSPPISILKPLCGMEHMAYENFASFCQQNYPVYQIVFGVKKSDDPIIDVVQQIMLDFPHLDIQLVLCEQPQGANPKISSLISMQEKATYDFLLISDSDVRVSPDYLSQIIEPMQDNATGIVSCFSRPIVNQGFTIVDALLYAAESFPLLLWTQQLMPHKSNMVSGCSALIRKTALEAIGGFKALADHIAEDTLMGKLATQAGYKIAHANCLVDHILHEETVLNLIQRKLRWMRGSFTYDPIGQFSLLATYGTLFSFLYCLTAPVLLIGVLVVCLVWLLRIIMVWKIGVYYLKIKSIKKYLWFVPLLDFIVIILWAYSFLSHTIHWRGNRFKVEKNGRLIPLGD